jgi:hypothetical protein
MVQYVAKLHDQLNRDVTEADLRSFVQARFRTPERLQEMEDYTERSGLF